MSPDNWIALAGIISTAFVAAFGLQWSSRIQRQQRREQFEREDRIRKDFDAKEEERLKIERVHDPQIEFDLSARFFGPEDGEYVVEVRINLTNRGAVRHELRDPRLRILGITKGDSLKFRAERRPVLAFPKKIFSLQSVLPEDYRYFFVEPGVKQDITFVTKVSSSVGFILVHGVFHYDRSTPHTAERVFEVGKDADSRMVSA